MNSAAPVNPATSDSTPHLTGMLRRIFSFPVFLGTALSAGAMTVTMAWESGPVAGGKLFTDDTWWHLKVGEEILATHHWPTHDIYSFTVPGAPWMAYEWLGEVVMAIAHRLAGLPGLAALLMLLAIAYVLLQYGYACLVSRNHLASAVAVALLLPVESVSFSLRPQLLGFIFLLITLMCLERFRQGKPRALWVLPGVFLLWANTHGSFLLGFLAIGLYWLSSLVSFRSGALWAEGIDAGRRQRVLLVSLLCLLACLVTPYGTRLAVYPLELLWQQPVIVQRIAEWQPLDMSQPYAHMFLLAVLLALAAQVAAPVIYRLDTLILVLLMIGESCLHARFLIIFAAVFAPVLATLLARWLPTYQKDQDHPVLNAALVAAIVCGMVAAFPARAKLDQALAETFPVGALQHLRQHPIPGRMFNDALWGGYLIWAAGPEHPVFIDGRFDIYEYGGTLTDCYNLISLRVKPESILAKYHINSVLLSRGSALDLYISSLAHWQRVYEDKISTILQREDASALVVGQSANSQRNRSAAE